MDSKNKMAILNGFMVHRRVAEAACD